MSILTSHQNPLPRDARPDRTPALTWNWLILGVSLGLVMYQIMVERGLGQPLATGIALSMLLACTGGGWLRGGRRRTRT